MRNALTERNADDHALNIHVTLDAKVHTKTDLDDQGLSDRVKSIIEDIRCANLIRARFTPRRNIKNMFGRQRHDVANLALYVICLELKRLIIEICQDEVHITKRVPRRENTSTCTIHHLYQLRYRDNPKKDCSNSIANAVHVVN